MFERGQGGRVDAGVAGEFHYHIVTAVFAFLARYARGPPDGRVVEQEAFDEALEQVDQIVVAADVRQFVDEDALDLSGRQIGEAAERHEDDASVKQDSTKRTGRERRMRAQSCVRQREKRGGGAQMPR